MAINRRGFIGSLLAALAAPKVPLPAVKTVRGCAVSTNGVPFGLAFHRNAFLLASPPIHVDKFSEVDFTFTDEDIKLPPEILERYAMGQISDLEMRFANAADGKFVDGDRW